MRTSWGWILLVGCGSSPEPARTPREPIVVITEPVTPSAPKPAYRHEGPPDVFAERIICAPAKSHAHFESLDGRPKDLLAFSAPAPPGRPLVNSHVRREAAVSAALDVALAIDDAAIDTSDCQMLTTTKRDTPIEVVVMKGAVESVARTDAGDEHLACVMRSICAVPLGRVSGKATVVVHLRPIAERPAVAAPKVTPDEAQKAMIEVVAEAAAACEQGQKLGSQAMTSVIEVGAMNHSTVAPTMMIGFKGPTDMNDCVRERVAGYRLPFSPWTAIANLRLVVTWDG